MSTDELPPPEWDPARPAIRHTKIAPCKTRPFPKFLEIVWDRLTDEEVGLLRPYGVTRAVCNRDAWDDLAIPDHVVTAKEKDDGANSR